MKILAGIVGGFFLAVLGLTLVSTTMAAGGSGPKSGVTAFFVMWVVGIVIAVMAPAAAKAWRRLLLTSAVLSFLMPLAGILYTGSFMAKMGSDVSGAATAGAAIGGGIVSGFLGFVGFFLGVVFLVIGLLVGRDKQVVYIERNSAGH